MATLAQVKPAPAKKPIVFINSDKENRDPLKHRSAINTHISILGHERRRQAQAQRLRELNNHVAFPAVVPADWSIHTAKVKLKNNICQICGSRENRHQCRRGVNKPKLPSLSSLLKEGNSDPFGTSLIVVNSTVSQLLEFNKKCILPSIHGREIDDGKTISYANSYWQDSIASLQDECQGCGYLARFAAILASATSDRKMAATAVVFKHRASELLRQKLADRQEVVSTDDSVSRTSLCWSIYSLLTADVAARNFGAAIMHARILRQFLQPDDPSMAVVDARLLHAALYNDIQRSSVSLTRPSFDLDRLAASQVQLRSKFQEFLVDGRYTRQKYLAPLDSSLVRSDLRCLFMQIRHLLEIAWLMAGNPELAKDSLIIYLSTWVLICEGRLVNIIIDADEEEIKKGRSHLLAQSSDRFAALAALYWLRRVSRHEGCGFQLSMTGSTAFNAGPIVLSRLREYLLASDTESSAKTLMVGGQNGAGCTMPKQVDSGVRLAVAASTHEMRLQIWISYIAALAERAHPAPSTALQSNLLALAKKIGHRTWRGICDSTLNGFLRDDNVDPDTAAWFDKGMQEMEE